MKIKTYEDFPMLVKFKEGTIQHIVTNPISEWKFDPVIKEFCPCIEIATFGWVAKFTLEPVINLN